MQQPTPELFARLLLGWHDKSARQMPWKQDRDPYKIWISEIILQQTRVAQGIPYFERFIKRFPTVETLANATEDEVLQQWQGLGYYSRARNLLASAKTIHFELSGRFPSDYKSLLKLKGIGPYTAAAIASFAFDEAKAVLDGNVIRVISRIYGIDKAYDDGPGKKHFQEWADRLLDRSQAAAYNQAIMDFGATLCTPKNPKCESCPFNAHCEAKEKDRIQDFPLKSKSIVRKKRYFHYLIIQNKNGEYHVQKRKEKDIWMGLYEFPLIETSKNISISEKSESLLNHKAFPRNSEMLRIQEIENKKHVLSHQDLYIRFYLVECKKAAEWEQENIYLVDYENLCNFAFPKIIDWFIAEKLYLYKK